MAEFYGASYYEALSVRAASDLSVGSPEASSVRGVEVEHSKSAVSWSGVAVSAAMYG